MQLEGRATHTRHQTHTPSTCSRLPAWIVLYYACRSISIPLAVYFFPPHLNPPCIQRAMLPCSEQPHTQRPRETEGDRRTDREREQERDGPTDRERQRETK